MNKVLSVVVLVLFLTGSFFVIGENWAEADDNTNDARLSQTKARKLNQDITEFSNGQNKSVLDFGTGGGTNADLNLTIPKRSTVLEASMDIKGLSTLDDIVFDYTDTVNNSAWHGEIASVPPTVTPSNYENKLFSNSDYNSISNEDGTLMRTNYVGGGPNSTTSGRPYHLFRFNISSTNPARLGVYWVGEGFQTMGLFPNTNEVYIYLYCPTNTTWSIFSTKRK